LKDGDKAKIAKDLRLIQAKYDEDKAAWAKREEVLEAEKKRLATWKVRFLDSKKKGKERVKDLEADIDEWKEKYGGIEVELKDLKKYVVMEHINGFQKGLQQAVFL